MGLLEFISHISPFTGCLNFTHTGTVMAGDDACVHLNGINAL